MEFEALVDTGSAGLRILPGVLQDSDLVTTSSTAVAVTFGGALTVTGPVATANVTLAGLTTPQPIPVQTITAIACTSEVPHCAAEGKIAATFSFSEKQGVGYRAILGIGMYNSPTSGDVANPIVQLTGHPAYIIATAGGYGATSATLTIGPTPSQRAKFGTTTLPTPVNGKPLADGSPTFNDKRNNVCIIDKTQGTSYCTPTSFDTGGGVTHVDWAPYQGPSMALPTGDSIDIQIHSSADPTSPLIGEYTFTVGETPKPGLDKVVINPSSTPSRINTGPQLFFRYQYLADQTNGLLGLAPR